MEGPGANGERDPSSGTEGTFTAAFIDSPLDLLVIGWNRRWYHQGVGGYKSRH